MTKNLAASVQARLLTRAKARNEDFNLLLTRYALERILYRLSILTRCSWKICRHRYYVFIPEPRLRQKKSKPSSISVWPIAE